MKSYNSGVESYITYYKVKSMNKTRVQLITLLKPSITKYTNSYFKRYMIENKYFSDNTSDYTIAEVKDLFNVIVSSKIPNVELMALYTINKIVNDTVNKS